MHELPLLACGRCYLLCVMSGKVSIVSEAGTSNTCGFGKYTRIGNGRTQGMALNIALGLLRAIALNGMDTGLFALECCALCCSYCTSLFNTSALAHSLSVHPCSTRVPLLTLSALPL